MASRPIAYVSFEDSNASRREALSILLLPWIRFSLAALLGGADPIIRTAPTDAPVSFAKSTDIRDLSSSTVSTFMENIFAPGGTGASTFPSLLYNKAC